MSRFNNIENVLITAEEGTKHWISPSISIDAIVVVNHHVLFVKRSSAMSNPNKWCLPCGFLDFNESIFDGCRRELFEETGIDVLEQLIFNVDYRRPFALNGTALQFVFELDSLPVIKLNEDECTDYHWLHVDDIVSSDLEFAFNHNMLADYIMKNR